MNIDREDNDFFEIFNLISEAIETEPEKIKEVFNERFLMVMYGNVFKNEMPTDKYLEERFRLIKDEYNKLFKVLRKYYSIKNLIKEEGK